MQTEIKQLASALCKAQAVMKGASKDSNNTYHKSKYADLHSVWEAVRGPLSSNGLCVIQTTEPAEMGFLVITKLIHESGEYIDSVLPVRMPGYDMQMMGSAITYARRYGLMAIVGIAPEDDDGEKSKLAKTPATEKPAQPNHSKPISAQEKQFILDYLERSGSSSKDEEVVAWFKKNTGKGSIDEWTSDDFNTVNKKIATKEKQKTKLEAVK